MPLPITALYAAILTVELILLTHHVILARARTHVSIMHGDDMVLATRIRRQANFVENAPMALIVLALAELGGAGGAVLHAAGLLLVLGRVVHPFGLDPARPAHPLRIIGLLMGQAAMAICIVLIAMQAMS